MLNNVEQRENLGMALIASSRVDSYVEDDDAKAMLVVRDMADAATLGRLTETFGDPEASEPPSHAGNGAANHAANGAANGAAKGAAPAPNNDGRDRRGRFAPGNRGGVGNPFARQVAALRARMLAYCTPERMDRLIEKLFAMAYEGDRAAAKLILSYVPGKPVPVVDPDRVDVAEWHLFQEAAVIPQEFHKLSRLPDPAYQVGTARYLREMMTDQLARKFQVHHQKELLDAGRKERLARARQQAAEQRRAEREAAAESDKQQVAARAPSTPGDGQPVVTGVETPSTHGSNGSPATPPVPQDLAAQPSTVATPGDAKPAPSTNGNSTVAAPPSPSKGGKGLAKRLLTAGLRRKK
jgi:type II secretory pathway pseudopilin PulG